MHARLYFVELTVADWPAAIAWYREVLGLAVIMQVEADRFALLQAGAGRIALKGGDPQPGNTLVTLEVDDLAAAARQLEKHGVLIDSPMQTSPEGYRRLLLRDPDGHHLCLFDWK